jgi:integrase
VRAENKRQEWTPDYKREVEASIANHLSSLKLLPVADIDARVRATILDAMANTAPLMAEKVDRRLHGIMDYAVEQGWIKSNPLPRRRAKVQRKHYPAIVDPVQLGEVLRAARASDPAKAIMRAHLLLTFTAMRVSEVVGAKWEEFALHGVQVASGDHKMRRDPDAGNWSIPRSRMKRKDAERGPHVVPLPPELLAEMREWRTADGEGAMLVCPSPSDLAKPITPEGIEKFYRRTLQLAGKHSPHSWRSAFSTICREAGKSGDVIEAQLDHQVGSKIESAYDRATRLELRRELMRWYAGRLIAARDGATVLPLKGSA